MPSETFFASYNNLPIVNASSALATAQEFGFDASTFIGKANSYVCPSGEGIGQAWLLMIRGDVEKLTPGEGYDFVFGAGSAQVDITMYFVQAFSIFKGAPEDPNSLYLVELADVRWLASKTFIDKSYNVRSVGDPDGSFFDDTRDPGDDPDETSDDADWTWQTMLADIWDELPDAFGSFPGFPSGFTPNGTPHRFQYNCVSAWQAINDAARRIGLQLDYVTLAGGDGGFGFSEPGAADAALTSQLEEHAGKLLLNTDPIGPPVPKTVKVCFPAVYAGPEEEDVTRAPYFVLEYTQADYEEDTNEPILRVLSSGVEVILMTWMR